MVADLDDQIEAELAGEGAESGELRGRVRGDRWAGPAEEDQPRVVRPAGQGRGFERVPVFGGQVGSPLVWQVDGQLVEDPAWPANLGHAGRADGGGEVAYDRGQVELRVAVGTRLG